MIARECLHIIHIFIDYTSQSFFFSVYSLLFCRADGKLKFLTKGDNNAVDDRGLYAPGQLWLEKKDVVGRARGFVPYVGIVTILMNDYPKFKVCMNIYVYTKHEFNDISSIL